MVVGHMDEGAAPHGSVVVPCLQADADEMMTLPLLLVMFAGTAGRSLACHRHYEMPLLTLLHFP